MKSIARVRAQAKLKAAMALKSSPRTQLENEIVSTSGVLDSPVNKTGQSAPIVNGEIPADHKTTEQSIAESVSNIISSENSEGMITSNVARQSEREVELEKENKRLEARVEELQRKLDRKIESDRSASNKVPLETYQQLQDKYSKKEEENMLLHNNAAELQMLKIEMAELENMYQATESAMQRQLSVLTVEKMKLAQKVGLLEAENAEQRQQWLNYHKQWGGQATVHG